MKTNLVNHNFDKDFVSALKNPENVRHILLYQDLRRRGKKVILRENSIFLSDTIVYPVFENEIFLCREGIYGVIDQDGEINYYCCSSKSLSGNYKIDYFVGICNIVGNIAVHSGGTISSYLAKYSAEKNFAHIESGDVDEKLYAVYTDLVSRGLLPKSGLKYGAHFRVYVSQQSKHAEYLVIVVPPYLSFTILAGMCRVAHTVKKSLIIAEKNSEVKYYEYRWIKV